MRRVFIVIVALVISACGDERSPVAPSAELTLPGSRTPSDQSAAGLSVTTFTVTRAPSSLTGQHSYNVQLQLADAAGHGAWVNGIVFVVPGGYNSSCSFPGRVTPGETSWLPPVWCLDFESPGAPSTIFMTVSFSDDDGRPGRVESSASVTIQE